MEATEATKERKPYVITNKRPASPADQCLHYIHLDMPSGLRYLHSFSPTKVVTGDDGHVYATANLFNRQYRVRMLQRIPAWRIVDNQGRFLRVEFPEVVPLYEKRKGTKSQDTLEQAYVAPYIWSNGDDKRKSRRGKTLED
jgi:hypothetical protein